jgi:hypothetical protein
LLKKIPQSTAFSWLQKLRKIPVSRAKTHPKIQKQLCAIVFEQNLVATYLVNRTIESKVSQFKASQREMQLLAFLVCYEAHF